MQDEPASTSPSRTLRPGQLGLFLAVLVGAAGCDHASKQLAQAALANAPSLSLAAGAIRFELAFNPGAFLSLGAELPAWLRALIFQGVAPAALLILCAVMLRTGAFSRSALVGLGLVAGGGLANWTDRLLHGGSVTDFVSLGWGGLRTGIFNLADVAVVGGVALLLLASTRGPTPEPIEPTEGTAGAEGVEPAARAEEVEPGEPDAR